MSEGEGEGDINIYKRIYVCNVHCIAIITNATIDGTEVRA